MKINENCLKIEQNYLFSEIAQRIKKFQALHPDREVLRLSINDVTRPLVPAVVSELTSAALDMGQYKTFHGYGEEQGETFLREAIARYYRQHNVSIEPEDIFVGDGAKNDLGNLCDLFAQDNVVLLQNPVYPVYYDTNMMSGRKIIFLKGTKENGFLPMPDEKIHADLIYLCSPNNPTGAVYTRGQLYQWVEYAHNHHACIIYDAAYEAYVRSPALPRSIYEIAGAETCAIEINSLSKMAGFTGVRCGWTIVPRELMQGNISLHKLWQRRQTTKYNGTSYIVQRGAAAVFTAEGQRQIHEDIDYYMQNADIIKDALHANGIWSTGGLHAPYVWVQCPNKMKSWDCFDKLLEHYGIAGSPGIGFGSGGESWLRFSSFGKREDICKAAKILANLDWNRLKT